MNHDRRSNRTRRSLQKWNLTRLPICSGLSTKKRDALFYGPNAATDGKSAGRVCAPWRKRPHDPGFNPIATLYHRYRRRNWQCRRKRQIVPRVFGDVASRAHFRVLDPKAEGSIFRADAPPTAGDTVARPRPATFGGGKKPNATFGSSVQQRLASCPPRSTSAAPPWTSRTRIPASARR